MGKLEKLKELASEARYGKQIVDIIYKLKGHDTQAAISLTKTIFFSTETHPEVRYALATLLGNVVSQQQVFNQVLSYFILKTFPDQRSLIRALKSFANPDAVPSLIQYYTTEASLEERLDIIETLAAIQTPEAVEFLSQIYNRQVHYEDELAPEDHHRIRERASSTLSRHLMRLD